MRKEAFNTVNLDFLFFNLVMIIVAPKGQVMTYRTSPPFFSLSCLGISVRLNQAVFCFLTMPEFANILSVYTHI